MATIDHGKKGNAFQTGIWILVIILLIKMLGHFFAVHPYYDLHRDEYLHLDQANHLAWGYQSVPPLISWTSWIIKLLGNRIFWIKFFPALFGAATIAAGWKIAETLNGSLYAKTLTAVALLCSILFRINILYQPNSFDILSWTLVYLFLIKYVRDYETKWLIWLAVVFALGFLNKYNILFLALAVAAALLVTPERKIYTNKKLYLAAVIAFVLIAPNITWQFLNGFPVVHHMKLLEATQLVHVNRYDFLKQQGLLFFQAILPILAGLVAFFIYPPFKKYRVIGWSYLFCILLFVYFKGKDYYAIGLYPALIAFGAVYLDQLFATGWKRYLKFALLLITVICFYPYAIRLPLLPPAALGTTAPFNKTGPHRWEDGKEYLLSQDFADMTGWSELAHKTDSIYKTLPETEFSLVICDNYGQAGAINFYKDLHAVSFNADYINWFKLDRPVQNIILVTDADDTDRSAQMTHFEKLYLADSITNQFAREKGARIYVLQHAKIPLNAFLEKTIEKQKGRLRQK